MQSKEEKSDHPILPDIRSASSTKRRRSYIVTGGSGFLGSHIVEHLLHCDQNVIVLDNKYPCNDILCQIEQSEKSKFILCDITRYNDVYKAFNVFKREQREQQQQIQPTNILNTMNTANITNNTTITNCDNNSIDSLSSLSSSSDLKSYKIECVFHCAALTDPWGPPSAYEKVNVLGTQNIIRACQECNISKLIYTSSSSVVLDGTDCQNGDESMGYVSKKNHLNAYSYSKHRAEEAILLANNTPCINDKYNLLTCALRPHCIFGPRDTHFISQIINKAREGKISHMIGEGNNITDFSYIDNVVHAHMLAAKSLKSCNNHKAAGQVYFITNGEPTLFWSFLGAILQQLGCPRPTKSISYNVAYAIAFIMEFIYMIIGWVFGWRPLITRQMVCMMACHHWFSHAKATRDLGYKPIVTLECGIKKTVQWIKANQRRKRRYDINSYVSMTGSESTDSLRSLNSHGSNHYNHNHNHSHNQNNPYVNTNNINDDMVPLD